MLSGISNLVPNQLKLLILHNDWYIQFMGHVFFSWNLIFIYDSVGQPAATSVSFTSYEKEGEGNGVHCSDKSIKEKDQC